MTPITKTVIYILTIFFVTFSAMANDVAVVPPSEWEQHPEGVALAMFLITKTEHGMDKGTIKVYIKNTSNNVKYLPSNANDRAIQVFYIGSEGKETPLRDYRIKVQPVLASAMPNSRSYQPGEIGVRTIDLSASELAIVKEHQVLCLFYISNQQIGGYSPIESAPRMLTSGP